jgi:hypothetical protein
MFNGCLLSPIPGFFFPIYRWVRWLRSGLSQCKQRQHNILEVILVHVLKYLAVQSYIQNRLPKERSGHFWKVWSHAATLFSLFLIVYIHTHIHSIDSSVALAELHSIFLIAVRSVECLHWGAEPRIELWTAYSSPRVSVWATPHPKLDIFFIYINEKKFIIDMHEVRLSLQKSHQKRKVLNIYMYEMYINVLT